MTNIEINKNNYVRSLYREYAELNQSYVSIFSECAMTSDEPTMTCSQMRDVSAHFHRVYARQVEIRDILGGLGKYNGHILCGDNLLRLAAAGLRKRRFADIICDSEDEYEEDEEDEDEDDDDDKDENVNEKGGDEKDKDNTN